MKAYLTYFKSELLVGLNYRVAALSGLSTQFFWGLVYVLIYSAFYSHTNVDGINFKELMCYVWLNQAFFSLILLGIKDSEIMDSIKNGSVAYQLLRPYDLYTWWYIKHLAKRYANSLLRFSPIIIFSLLLPSPYNLSLPVSLSAFIMFLITLILGSLILCGIFMIVQSISFFTYQDKGISSIVYSVGSLLSGIIIPIPLLPNIVIDITEYLPFRLIGDLPFRIYSGNIQINSALISILMQIVWIIILIIIGKMIMKKVLTKASIQGG